VMFDLSDFSRLEGEVNGDDVAEAGHRQVEQVFETNKYIVEGEEFSIREYAFSPTNSGCVWKSSFPLCEYVHKNESDFRNKKIIELGSGTGIVSIYLRKQGYEITSSDIPDDDTTNNIKCNCELNRVEFKHIPHLWGNKFPDEFNDFDVILASDIILYENHYNELLHTLKQILSKKEHSFFIMTYKRKAYGEKKFFQLLEEGGFYHELIGSKMWRICLNKKT